MFLRLLKPGGRTAVIVPDGVLFGSTKAHRELRRLLVEDKSELAEVLAPPTPVHHLQGGGRFGIGRPVPLPLPAPVPLPPPIEDR